MMKQLFFQRNNVFKFAIIHVGYNTYSLQGDEYHLILYHIKNCPCGHIIPGQNYRIK